jgi:hypothetical protein
MCKDKVDCLSCMNEKIDNILGSIERISEKLDKLDKIVNNYDGLVVRINYIDMVLSKAAWIIGTIFVGITSIFFKIMFKV